jgi:hypothetical protein
MRIVNENKSYVDENFEWFNDKKMN